MLHRASGVAGGAGRTLVFVSVVVLVAGAYSARTVARNEGSCTRSMQRALTRRCADWFNEQTIFKAAAEVFPGNCKMQHNYATTLDDVHVRRCGAQRS